MTPQERKVMELALEALEDYVDEYGPWSDDSGAQYVLRVGKEALAQPDQFNPDWDAMAVMVEEMQRMAKRTEDLEAMLEALAQPEQEPEFIKHEVESAEDWSEWVCPNPKGYLMKCCDCGLVHEAEFGVVRYKSKTEREYCDMVGDPNVQAVFRMRRSEQWSPEDTAHRAGGLPMAQPKQAQDEPVAVVTGVYGGRFIVEPTNSAMVLPVNMALYAHPQRKPLTKNGYHCVICGRFLLADEYGVILHDDIEHSPEMTFDDEENPQ